MRLVDFEEFCRMPAGTIFAPYEPCALVDSLAVKVGEGIDMSLDHEWCGHTFVGVMPLEPWNIGPSGSLLEVGDAEEAVFRVYDGSSTDYMEYDMFLVFDEYDIDKMIDVLKWAKGGCKGDI